MTLLILEGGITSLQVMDLIPRSVLVTEDKELFLSAKNIFSENRVVFGGWQIDLLRKYVATKVIVGYDDDNRNLQIGVELIHLGDQKVICYCHDSSRMEDFHRAHIHNIYCPSELGAKMIAASINPSIRDLIEIPIFGDSPLLGRKVEDIQYGLDAFVAGLVEGEEIVKLEGRLLEKGDHMLIVSLGGRSEELQKTIVRKEARLKVFEKISVVILNEADVVSTLSEAIYLANLMRSELTVLSSSQELVEKCQSSLKTCGLRYRTVVKEISDLQSISDVVGQDGLETDCLVMKSLLEFKERKSFRKWKLRRFLEDANYSILLSKKKQPYFSMLALMDGCENAKEMIEGAFKLCFLSRSAITVLRYLEDASLNGKENNLRNIAKLYGVRALDVPVEGNIAVEFVSNIRSGSTDLAFMNWDSNSLRDDIVGRIIVEGPVSLLIFKGI